MTIKKQEQDDQARSSAAFLIAQLGAHAAVRFAERVSEIGLTPPLVGILRAIANDPGCSQRQLATRLGLLPSKMVTFVDVLETRALVERKRSTTDRRQYELRLTTDGQSLMRRIGTLARTHDHDLCQALDADEHASLVELLSRISEQQGLAPGVHPGFTTIGEQA